MTDEIKKSQKQVRETIDVHTAISEINTCIQELMVMQSVMERYDDLDEALLEPSSPAETNAYCRLQQTRAGIINTVISANLKLVAKVLPDAVAEEATPMGDVNVETSRDQLIERFSSKMPGEDSRTTSPSIKRLN